jgi:PAS domain S-box-containing protein
MDGYYLGSVNLWQTERREFTDNEVSLLESFAEIVGDELELHRALLERQKQQTLLNAMFDNSAVGIAVYNFRGQRVVANQKYCGMFGYTTDEMIGQTTADVDSDDDREILDEGMRKVATGELKLFECEARLIHKSGKPVWCRFKLSRITNAATGEHYVLSFVENIDDKHAAEQARNLLLGEVNHRVKNTLAIVQGIARQLMRTAPDASTFAAAFEARVQALAKSHDILTQASWQPLPLNQLVANILGETWQPFERQIRFSGPAVPLNSQTTVMLGLLLNELITNAVKHGALRSHDGRVEIAGEAVTIDGRPWMKVSWRERSNLPIRDLRRRGLGLYLLERAPKLGLSGTGSLAFAPGGFEYEVTFPVFEDSYLFAKGLAG